MKLDELKIGTRIYYGGDMANQSGFGTITGQVSDKWGQFVNIKMDDGRKIGQMLPVCAFSPEYKGHGGTRFVTLAAYNDFCRQRVAGTNYEYKDAI